MPRFATITDEEAREIQAGKDAVRTKKQTELMSNILLDYIREKKIVMNLETASKQIVNQFLESFYFEVRKKDGGMYKKTSFFSLRFALQRYFKELRGDDFDIISNEEFNGANSRFSAQCVVLKRNGLAKVDHYPPILVEDVRTMYASEVFDIKSPVGLQRKVFFELMLNFCRRGMENLRELTVHDFELRQLSNGTEVVIKTSDELTKNHRVDSNIQDEGVMKSTGTENCPVAAYKSYVSKLHPRGKAFFLVAAPPSGHWYDNMVLGVKSLEKMMKRISVEAKLSYVYTNHSIRSTCITILDQAGIEARHIMAVSGHTSESSLRTYARTSTEKRNQLSALLSENTSNLSAKKPRIDLQQKDPPQQQQHQQQQRQE